MALFHPTHVSRLGRKQQCGEDLLHDGPYRRKHQPGGAPAHAFALDVRVRDRRQDDMVLPAGIAPALEVVEAQLSLEYLVLRSTTRMASSAGTTQTIT